MTQTRIAARAASFRATIPAVSPRCTLFQLLLLAACGGPQLPSPAAVAGTAEAPPPRCVLPGAPMVVHREGNAVLQVWEVPAAPVLFEEVLPSAPGYLAYREAIAAAGGDLERPVADSPQPRDDAERELWRREDENAALMYGDAGRVRPIRCLEAALFAAQDARYSELTQPTAFIASILLREVGGRPQLKIYFGASDSMFPPKAFYGFDEVRRDVAAGWEYWVVLHNHTVRTLNGKPALGVPAPSTSDVPLFRGLVKESGLRAVWVTNGFYTGEATAQDLARYRTRD
ncbi:hypothetical protein ACSRUE_32270 [Sorangium sp. KYC3313]|uniref:hypothetical protein n=1 Tax=Sorangium sp. KYC3313 TaxID=3449740 RepID=UPI003F8ABB0B